VPGLRPDHPLVLVELEEDQRDAAQHTEIGASVSQALTGSNVVSRTFAREACAIETRSFRPSSPPETRSLD
jgi:hypothetical protein